MKHIIIVDDKLENRYMLESLLKGEEFTVIPANNGEEALMQARKSPPDLIISDILMPVMDGFTLCKEWRMDESLREIPFIFYSAAYTSPQDIRYALKLGADRFLIKPQEPEEFLIVIRQLLNEFERGSYRPEPELHKHEANEIREYSTLLFRKLEDQLLQSEQTELKLKRYDDELEKNIEKLRRCEENVRQTVNLLDNLINFGNVPLITWNSKFIIVRFNQAAANLTGFPSDEVLGQKLDVLFPESNKKEILSVIEKSLTKDHRKEIELTISTKEKENGSMQWNLFQIMDDNDEQLISAITLNKTALQQDSRAGQQEQMISERTLELENSREQLRALSLHLQNVREEERKYIAREIHDELGHLLTALKLDMEGLLNQSDNPTESIGRQLSPLISMVDAAIDSVKTIATELRPAILDTFGLLPAMEWQIQQFRIRTNKLLDYHFDVKDFTFSNEESTAIFRIFQEILTNISRHSNATHVQISFTNQDGKLLLKVKDNGVGFDLDMTMQLQSFGLLGMSERALSIGGKVSVKSIPGIGTTVQLSLDKSGKSTYNQPYD